MKSYIDDIINADKVNMRKPTKSSFVINKYKAWDICLTVEGIDISLSIALEN